MKSVCVVCVASAAAVALGSSASAGVIADSVAEFSSTQGQDGWYYGFYNVSVGDSPTMPGTFNQLEEFAGESQIDWSRPGTSSWVSVDDDSQHPHLPGIGGGNDPSTYWVARRWESDRAGMLNVAGRIEDADVGGDGVLASIYVDGSEVMTWDLPGNNTGNVLYDMDINVLLGSTVDFVITPKQSINFDGTIFTAVITPAPATALVLLPVLGLSRRRR